MRRWHNDPAGLSEHGPRRIVIAIRIIVAARIIIPVTAAVAIWIVVSIWILVAIWAVALCRRNVRATGLRIGATHISVANLVVVVIGRPIDHDRLIISAAAVVNLPAISASPITIARVINESGLGSNIAFVRGKSAQRLNFATGYHHRIISAALRQLVGAAFRIAVNVDDWNRPICPRVAQSWTRNRMIPGRWITNVPT